eukprot:3737879-Rhodomonas_salina.2
MLVPPRARWVRAGRALASTSVSASQPLGPSGLLPKSTSCDDSDALCQCFRHLAQALSDLCDAVSAQIEMHKEGALVEHPSERFCLVPSPILVRVNSKWTSDLQCALRTAALKRSGSCAFPFEGYHAM